MRRGPITKGRLPRIGSLGPSRGFPMVPMVRVNLDALLTIILVVLRLSGAIGWSWWWVLSPLWIQAAVVLVLVGAAVMLGKWPPMGR